MSLRVRGRSRVIDVLLIAALAVAGTIPAFAAETHQFNVPAEDAPTAIRDFASQAHVQILVAGENVKEKHLHPVSGEFSTDQGLRLLLADSGLNPQYVGDRSIALVTASDSTPLPQGNAKEGKKSSSGEFRVAQLDQRTNSQSPALENSTSNSQDSSKKAELTEIVVTAQKREERLLDVPQSVSVVSADDIANLGATQFSDFANTVPGLSFTTLGVGQNQITLRGVTSGGNDNSPTVAVYIDEVPYGSSTPFALAGRYGLDAGLFDLDRVEVLRGPQGTLYGASSIGGIVKYVTNPPDTGSFSGDARIGVSDTGDGGGVNYDGAAAVNMPLVTNEAAVRLSGYYSHNGGYIDDVEIFGSNSIIKDVNSSHVEGGRLDFLLTPTDALSIRINGFVQDISRSGDATADYRIATGAPAQGGLDQLRGYPGAFDQHFHLVSGTVTYDLGSAALTSVSSYQTMRSEWIDDVTAGFVPELNSFGLGPYSAAADPVNLTLDKFTQEIRLASKGTNTLEWLIGGFYTHESASDDESFATLNPARQPVANDLYTYDLPTTYSEYAAFGDLTWHLTSKFDVTGGLRYAHDQQDFQQTGSGLFGATSQYFTSSEGVFTYLANARYRFTDHMTGYLRYATGYRPGGPAIVVATDPTAPNHFNPDHLKSYEAGIRSETANQHFVVDLSVYDIDWTDIQVNGVVGGFSTFTNSTSPAHIQGSELALTARPLSGLNLTGAFAYQHAYMVAADPNLGSAAGARMPNVPRFTGTLNADYQVPQTNLQPTIGATLRYVSDRNSGYDNSTVIPQFYLPGYTVVDLRTGLSLSSMKLQLYVHNLLDRRGELSAGNVGQFGSPYAAVSILQPRTVGMYLTTRF